MPETTTHTAPEGFHTITPVLTLEDADSAIAWYKRALGATELARSLGADGRVTHVLLNIGDSPIRLREAAMGERGAKSLGECPASLLLYVADCDAVFKRAVNAGAREVKPLKNHYWGDRGGAFVDPFGYCWTVSTHKEELTDDQLKRRHKDWLKAHVSSAAPGDVARSNADNAPESPEARRAFEEYEARKFAAAKRYQDSQRVTGAYDQTPEEANKSAQQAESEADLAKKMAFGGGMAALAAPPGATPISPTLPAAARPVKPDFGDIQAKPKGMEVGEAQKSKLTERKIGELKRKEAAEKAREKKSESGREESRVDGPLEE